VLLLTCGAAGRGYPDVSGFGTAYVTINGGEIVPAAGTSASVPLIATFIAWSKIQTNARHAHPHLHEIISMLMSDAACLCAGACVE